MDDREFWASVFNNALKLGFEHIARGGTLSDENGKHIGADDWSTAIADKALKKARSAFPGA